MQLEMFNELMDKFGVACITYTALGSDNRKFTFVYGTTDFSDKHIKDIEWKNIEIFGSPRPEVNEGEVLIFSYSKNRFRKLPLKSIKRVTSLAEELNKAALF